MHLIKAFVIICLISFIGICGGKNLSHEELNYLSSSGININGEFALILLNKNDCIKCKNLIKILSEDKSISGNSNICLIVDDLSSDESFSYLKINGIETNSIRILCSDSINSIFDRSSFIYFYSEKYFIQKESILQYNGFSDFRMDFKFYSSKTINIKVHSNNLKKFTKKIGQFFIDNSNSYFIVSSKDTVYTYSSGEWKKIKFPNLNIGSLKILSISSIGKNLVVIYDSLGIIKVFDGINKKSISVPNFNIENSYMNGDYFVMLKNKWYVGMGFEIDSVYGHFIGSFNSDFSKFQFEMPPMPLDWLNDSDVGVGKLKSNNNLTLFCTEVGHKILDATNSISIQIFPQKNIVSNNFFHIRHLVLGVESDESFFYVLYSINRHLYCAFISRANPEKIVYKRIHLPVHLGQSSAVSNGNYFSILNFSEKETVNYEILLSDLRNYTN